MICTRCPHHVRHGRAASDGKSIEFRDICGLKVKKLEREEMEKAGGPPKKADKRAADTRAPSILATAENIECSEVPFPDVYDYMECDTYIATFKSTSRKNDVVPTKDFQYSDALSSSSITDMELL